MNETCDSSPNRGTDWTESYELSPMQQGMFFHSVDEHLPGVDIEQVSCRMQEGLDETAFLHAWQSITDRHSILRTRFQWEGLEEPTQRVCRSVRVPHVRLDWSAVCDAVFEANWEQLIRSEREHGFNLGVAPLMRLVLVKRAPNDVSVLWTFHHILLDGRSFPVVLGEVFSLYDALRQGHGLRLPETRPFGDYIRWLRTVDIRPAEAFWRDQLRGFRAPTPLTISRTMPSAGPELEAMGEREIKLTVEETTSLRICAEQHGFTVNSLFQGAWSILLHRYSGEDDIVFGATRACRHWGAGDTSSLVGLFINTLPVRIKLGSDTSVLELLGSLRSQQVRVREYEHTPLVKVQSWSELPGGIPLFESILVFDHATLDDALKSSGISNTNRRFGYRGQTNYPLTLIGYGGRELLLRVEYDRRRFEDADIERMLGHLRNLLNGIVAQPEAKIADLPMLTESERQKVLHDWNRCESFQSDQSIHRLFERQVDRTPEAVAVRCDQQQLTYSELNSRSNQLALKLRECGVTDETLVGLCVDRSIEMVVGILGILKAGGAYVPLDPTYPKDRLAFMIEDAQMHVVVMDRKRAGELPCLGSAEPLYLDDLDRVHTDNLAVVGAPDNAAYVIYTSGSTGKPKGVVVTHRNVVRLFEATESWFHFNERDVWTLFHSYAFDFSVWELWGALLRGGRLVVVPYWVSRSPDVFLELLEKEQVTVLNQTPSAFRQLIAAEAERSDPSALALRFIVFGGEALELQSLKPWFDRHGDRHPVLVNMYGITETAVHVTYRPINLEDVETRAGSVIGVPIPDLQVYVLDKKMQPVPVGVPGELYVGGAGVSRGYLNRDELTLDRFIPDPFGQSPDARLYKTGDLARRLSNGDLEYLGRIDLQVKIRGFRIELGEIEAALNQHPAVRESAVIARQELLGDKRLVAYVVTDGDEPGVVGDLRSSLQQKLPEYMVPSAFVILESMPINENGKVDRKRLPVPEFGRSDSQRPFVAPVGEMEQRIAKIWQDLFQIQQVAVDVNFFDLGGHSLLLMRARQRLREAVDRDVAVVTLLRYPTIRSLASHLGGGEADAKVSADVTHRAKKQREAALRHRRAHGRNESTK